MVSDDGQTQNVPVQDVTVTIPAKWVKRIHSPLGFFCSALIGVSVSFGPVALFYLGRSQEEIGSLKVAVCFGIVCLIPCFYISLAQHVMSQVPKPQRSRAIAGEH